MTTPADPNVIELLTGLLSQANTQAADSEFMKREIKEISAQVKITNGRVSALEVWRITQEAIRTDRELRSTHAGTSRLLLTCALVSGPMSALITALLTLFLLH